MQRHKTVDDFISGSGDWQEALIRLRRIIKETELEETVKWCGPCYAINGKNVVGLEAFKSYGGLWFYQGGPAERCSKGAGQCPGGYDKSPSSMAISSRH